MEPARAASSSWAATAATRWTRHPRPSRSTRQPSHADHPDLARPGLGGNDGGAPRQVAGEHTDSCGIRSRSVVLAMSSEARRTVAGSGDRVCDRAARPPMVGCRALPTLQRHHGPRPATPSDHRVRDRRSIRRRSIGCPDLGVRQLLGRRAAPRPAEGLHLSGKRSRVRDPSPAPLPASVLKGSPFTPSSDRARRARCRARGRSSPASGPNGSRRGSRAVATALRDAGAR